MIVWEISLGTLLTLGTVLVSAAGFYWKQNYDSKEIKEDIRDIKDDIKILNKLIIESAILTKDIIYLKDRVELFERRFDKVLDYLRRDGHNID